jgi:hypothetical protein
MDNEWATVANAARILGTSKQAIRQRIYRGTIEHRKDPEGTVYVRITEHNEEPNADSYGESYGDMPSVSRELVEELRARVGSLENQLEHERRANAEQRRLLAAALERIPAIEAPQDTSPEASPEQPEWPESAEGTQYGTSPQEAQESLHNHRPWWRRWFGV